MKRKLLLVGLILFVTLLFQSPGSAVPYSYGMNMNFMNAVYEIWKPSFPILNYYWEGFTWLLAVPYLILMWIFLRKVKLDEPTLWIAGIYTLAFGLILGYPVYREPIMPLIILWLFSENDFQIESFKDCIPKEIKTESELHQYWNNK